MPEIKLKIEDLVLDHDNPRIAHAEGQQEALQKIVKDQKLKLVRLAQSIVRYGLNPMDRFLVLRTDSKPVRFIALEGNRRVAVFKLLSNPASMTGLDMPDPMKKVLERLAGEFSKGKIEPIPAFELSSRQEGDYWLELRHKGEQGGAGIVGWENAAQNRFGTRSPTIQALDMVTEQGGLTPDQLSQVAEKFPTTTLQRLIEDRQVRKELGIDVKQGKLVTDLPAAEVMKPLRRIVLDLATKKRRVGSLMKTDQMLEYVRGFGKSERADLSKSTGTARSVDEIPVAEFTKGAKTTVRRKSDPSDRREIVQKGCPVHVTDNRISEIYKELRTLKLDDAPNGIAVLLRVFLELSVDHFLENNGSSPSFAAPNGKTVHKKLEKKLAETVSILVSTGVPERHFNNVTRALAMPTSPLNVDLLHRYVHDRFATPTPAELKAAWDHASPLFEKIWPVK